MYLLGCRCAARQGGLELALQLVLLLFRLFELLDFWEERKKKVSSVQRLSASITVPKGRSRAMARGNSSCFRHRSLRAITS